MPEPGYWHLEGPEGTSMLAEWDRNEELRLETVICPVNEGHRRAGKRLSGLSVMLPRPGVDDFVWTWSSECLITDRVLDLFRLSGFAGFETRPVRTRCKRQGSAAPRLWELIVTGWAGMAPPESGIELIEDCPACGHKVYSAWTDPEKLIVPSQWDGSDLFMVWPLPGHVFVSERVARVVLNYELSGVIAKPSGSLIFPHQIIPEVTPGRLSYYMPENRARELGERLGIY
jgi:hypothetical protein